MKELGTRLQQARKSRDLTQSQVAEKLGVSTQSVSAWETGASCPDLEKIPELAALLRVTTDWLLTGRTPSKLILEETANLSDRLFSETRMATYVGSYCNARGMYQTIRALAFAEQKHAGQYRRRGHSAERIPYIYHPLLLTCHAMALGLDDEDLLSACLLHDVCEDCGVEPEELPVSEACREAVRLLTKPAGFDKSAQAERAYYDAIAANRVATVVKLLDRCSNLSGMATSFSEKRMVGYMQETRAYVLPLMEQARDRYPELANPLFLIRYHMNSVMESLRHHMRSQLDAGM